MTFLSTRRGEPFSLFEQAKDPNSRWLIVGEAPGEEEDHTGRPFVGASGKLLTGLLQQVGFSRADFHITNVFTSRPPDNDLKKHWTVTKTELTKLGYSVTGRLPKLNNRFIHPDYEGEIARLREEIRQLAPEFILALGGTALWALTGESRITVNRGSLVPLAFPAQEETSQISSIPQLPSTTPSCQDQSRSHRSNLPDWAASLSPLWCLPSFHPAMVLRQWDNRPLLWADLLKARRFLTHQLPPPLRRRLWLDPTLEELEEVYQRFSSVPSEPLGVDIETDPRIGLLTTISFATPEEAVCIPFWNKNALADQANYWHTAAEEAKAWRYVQRFAALPNPKVLQNGLYDQQYLLEAPEVRLRNYNEDTAILQHCLQPELPKALGTLASLYLNEPAWKLMRDSNKDAKADE